MRWPFRSFHGEIKRPWPSPSVVWMWTFSSPDTLTNSPSGRVTARFSSILAVPLELTLVSTCTLSCYTFLLARWRDLLNFAFSNVLPALQSVPLTLILANFSDATPSFVLMDISDTSVVVFIYKLIDEKLKVEKIKYEPKQQASA